MDKKLRNPLTKFLQSFLQTLLLLLVISSLSSPWKKWVLSNCWAHCLAGNASSTFGYSNTHFYKKKPLQNLCTWVSLLFAQFLYKRFLRGFFYHNANFPSFTSPQPSAPVIVNFLFQRTLVFKWLYTCLMHFTNALCLGLRAVSYVSLDSPFLL